MDKENGPPGFGSIQFLTGSLAGTTIQISKPTITLGRELDNDIVVSDPSVSRHHVQLMQNNGVWMINKLVPQNVVKVNQREVNQAIINDNDTITLGRGTTFLFQSGRRAQKVPSTPHRSFQAPSPPPPSPVVAQQFSPPPLQSSFIAQQPPGTSKLETYLGNTAPAPREEPALEVSSNIHSDKPTFPLSGQVINIGRDPSNDIVIKERVVSGFHAQIVHEGDKLVFIHPHPSRQKTLNGILYQGRHIAGDQPFRKPLERGDIFRIGDEHGTLVTLTFNDGSGTEQEIVPEIRPIPLGAPLITIGRLADNMVVLNHPQVSAHHAQLRQVQGGYRIIDLNATNHIFVNAQQVTNQLLKAGDEVRIGPFKLIYTGTQLTQHDESSSIRIDALHLKKVGNKQTVLINDISLVIPPRKFVAIVGGSGTGKTTLMDALNGLRPAQQGAVLYNGQDYYKHLAAFNTQLGYVPQEDIIHRDLTAGRALYYAAKMRLPSDYTEEQLKKRIDEVLEDVEMTSRRNLLVSKLSGGQRKRVSIALELLANPSLFFLDEPTSGLDPGLDRKMMLLLRNLADKGHTIVLVTHATNNINSCDYVCFLAQGGRLGYFGPPDEAKKYFDKTDFAEIYSALEPTEQDKDIPTKAEAKFKASQYYQQYVAEPLKQGPAGRVNVDLRARANARVAPTIHGPSGPLRRIVGTGNAPALEKRLPKPGNPRKQFPILSRRYIELLRNDKGNLLILLLQAPLIGLILFFLAGHGTFDPTSVATCPTRATLIETSGPIVSLKCQRVADALNTPGGQQYAAAQHKSAKQLVQDAIEQGSGGDAQKILFIMAFAAVMFGCINGVREIVKEGPIYRRERAVNLGIAPYMFSKIVVLGVLCLLQSAVLVILVNMKAPLQQGIFLPPIVEIYITMALTSLAGMMVGLTVSAIAPNNDRALSFIPIILIPQVIFSGITFPLDNPVLQGLGSFFAARWAMAGMGSTIGLHGDKLGSGGDFAYEGTLFSPFSKGQATIHLLLIWLALLAMIVLLGAATAYFLKRKDVRA